MHRTTLFILFTFFSLTVFSQSEPSSQPTGLMFTNIKAWMASLSFVSNGADGYLVLKSDADILDSPNDGVSYQRGQWIGNAKVIYSGPLSFISVREILEGSTYHFAIFAFNGSGTSVNYKTSNPLKGTLQSAVADPGDYYIPIDAGAQSFMADLTNLLQQKNFLAYDDFRSTVVPSIYERDTVNGQKTVQCQYSGEVKVYVPPFGWQATNSSREHRLCQSWMKIGGNTVSPPGTDFHNLELVNQNQVNSVRSNFPYGEVVTPTNVFLNGKLGLNAQGKTVYEPREEQKGDAARSQFYMLMCYDEYQNSGNWGYADLPSFASDQDENVLRQWHQQDPVDKLERTRNQYIYTIQNNRNPFVDHPEWIDCIDFTQLQQIAPCSTNVGITDIPSVETIRVFPVPAYDLLSLQSPAVLATVQLLDLNGRMIREWLHSGESSVSVADIPSGCYVVRLTVGQQAVFKKVIIQ